jgi:hypothetical protein
LLAAEVGRRPRNLHTHLQRISLWADLDDSAAVTAAIVDFWIVLGPAAGLCANVSCSATPPPLPLPGWPTT